MPGINKHIYNCIADKGKKQIKTLAFLTFG